MKKLDDLRPLGHFKLKRLGIDLAVDRRAGKSATSET